MQILSGGTCNWPLKGGARLIEVAATAGGTVFIFSLHCVVLDVLQFLMKNLY